MAKKAANAAQVAEKWSRNLQNAGQSILDGIANVDEAPGIAAGRAQQRWLDRINEMKDVWKKRVEGVTVDQWRAAMRDKAVPRIRAAAAASQPRFEAFMREWLAYEEQVVAGLKAKPRGTLDQNIARAEHVMRENAKAKGRFRKQ